MLYLHIRDFKRKHYYENEINTPQENKNLKSYKNGKSGFMMDFTPGRKVHPPQGPMGHHVHLPQEQPLEETITFSPLWAPPPPPMPSLSKSGSPHKVVSDPKRQDPAKKAHPAMVYPFFVNIGSYTDFQIENGRINL